MMRRSTLLTVVALLLAGCSATSTDRGPSYGGEDGKKIARRVDALIDDRSSHPRMSKHFAKGAAPDARQWPKYAPYAFEVVGDPSISGTTATAKVRIVQDSDRKEVGQVEWSFVKEGEDWKI